jgi:membrane fusion protein (multidrug efflux system)
MPLTFSRTRGRLDLERRRGRALVIITACLLLGAWTAWLFASRVAVYAVSDSARLEVDRQPYPVEAPVPGRVVANNLTMGRTVKAGEVLVDLDVRAQALDVSEERARIGGIAPQIARLQAEITEQINSRTAARAAASVARQEARARYEEAKAAADFAASTETRTKALADKGLTGQAELVRAQSEAKQRRAAAEALGLTAERIAAEQQHADIEQAVKIERLEREVAQLRAQVATGTATVQRLQHEGTLRQIVAPVDGTLAEVATLPVGRVLQPGQAVATIIPAGALRIVAGFMPAEAFGRVRAGQAARLRLDGFPPTQYGSIAATVSNVAREPRDGQVRVELALDGTEFGVPMQHGLPGSVEVEIERVSPAALVLRAVGRRMASASGRR